MRVIKMKKYRSVFNEGVDKKKLDKEMENYLSKLSGQYETEDEIINAFVSELRASAVQAIKSLEEYGYDAVKMIKLIFRKFQGLR